MSDNSKTGATVMPYKELFTCGLDIRNEDGDCVHDEPCEWTWECSACGRYLPGKDPCPDHAPQQVPGLQLIACENGHARTWVLDDDGYDPPCPWCMAGDAAKAHEGCEHARHGRWRRLRIVRRALARLYSLGIVKGYSVSYGGGCHGCAAHVSFGRNSYLLGWPRWKWQCVLGARHWPGEEVAGGLCGKCAPCPACGSQRIAHERTCEWAS